MIEGDEFVFIIIVCIIIVAIIVAALLISKKVNIRKYDGEGDDINDFIQQFNKFHLENQSDGPQIIINNMLNTYPYMLKKLKNSLNGDFLKSDIQYNNTILQITNKLHIFNKCSITVIYDTELKFNCKYNILGVEFEENILLVDITTLVERISAYLANYLTNLEHLENLDYLNFNRLYTDPNTLKISNTINTMIISIIYNNGLNFKFIVTNNVTNKTDEEKYIAINPSIPNINERIQPMIDIIKHVFSNRLIELKKKYDDLVPHRRKTSKSSKTSKPPPYLVTRLINNQLILTMRPEQKYKNKYKFIILLIEDELRYIANLPYIPIEFSTQINTNESDLDSLIKEFFEQENPLQAIYKILQSQSPDIQTKINSSTSLIIVSNKRKNFMVSIELIYNKDKEQVEFKYTEQLPHIVPINYVSRSIQISAKDDLISHIIRFFTPPLQEGGASKFDNIDPNTQISLPGTEYNPDENPRNLFYRLQNGTYRYPELIHIDDRNFSINLMWISSVLDNANEYIGGYIIRESKNFEDIFPEQIIKWMVLNSNATVNLWFDSKMCSQNQIKQTENYINNYIKKIKSKGIKVGKFNMLDIQRLKIIKQYPIIASVDWPIYSRVDLLRLIAAYETQIQNNTQNIQSAFVYADYTINPHSLRKVYPYGISNDGFIGLYGNTSHSGYENSYMIFGSYNIHMLSTLEDFILSILCRIQAESRRFITRRRFYDAEGKFATGVNCFTETFAFSLFGMVMLSTNIRKTIDPNRYIYFNCIKANIDPNNIDVWSVFYGFESYHKFEIEINNKLYKLGKLNIESKIPSNYMCVIYDKRVSAIRQSGHTTSSTSVQIYVATNLIDIIKDINNIDISNQDAYNKFMSTLETSHPLLP